MDIAARIEALVLAIHRRNGGQLARFDPECRLLDPGLGLDSLDLAEVLVAVEREFGFSPFDQVAPPRTWGELARAIERAQTTG